MRTSVAGSAGSGKILLVAEHEHEQLSWIDYQVFYHNAHSKPLAILTITLWLAFLFSFVGIVASDFFCPNLSTISQRLGLSENLAGVTLLGFGNGAPDVFSTYAAFKANTGALAIGELIGAAAFILSVVVGSMSIISPFKIPRHAFLRDIAFFILAILFIIPIIHDGNIHRWQANTLILLYLVYVAAVLLSSWSVQRTRIKLDQLQIARSQYATQDDDDQVYLDHPDFPIQPPPENAPLIPELISPTRPTPPHRLKTSTSTHSQDSFKSLLETSCYPLPVRQRRMRAPSLSYRPGPAMLPSNTSSPNQSFAALPPSHPSVPSQDGSSNGLLGSPELNRRRARRSTVVMTPFRPSLLGAIEFRDVVNSLARDSSGIRPGSPQPGLASPIQGLQGRRSRSASIVVGTRAPSHNAPGRRMPAPTRADSDRPRRKTEFMIPEEPAHPVGGLGLGTRPVGAHHRLTQSQGAIVPPTSRLWHFPDTESSPRETVIDLSSSTRHPSFHLPSPSHKAPAQTPVSPTHKTAAPLPSILITSDRHEILALPDSPDRAEDPARVEADEDDEEGEEEPPRNGWTSVAYTVWITLFPTLQHWKIKSLLGKAIALVSAPAVLLLTITLPVVDETEDDGDGQAVGDNEDEEDEEEDETGMQGCALGMDIEAGRGEDSTCRGWSSKHRLSSSPASDASARPTSPERASYAMVDVRPGLPDQPSATAAEEEGGGGASAEMDHADAAWDDGDAGQPAFDRPHIARLLAAVQSFLAPLFWKLCLEDPQPSAVAAPLSALTGPIGHRSVLTTLGCVVLGLGLSRLVFGLLEPSRPGSRLSQTTKIALCVLGFANSMLWILSIVNEVVAVLAVLAHVFHVQDAVLGLTVFAVGNSLGDFVANLTLARMGFPVMAMSACFGGPLLNILLGIGLSSTIVMTTRGTSVLEVGGGSSSTLLVAAGALLCLLLALAALVPLWKGFCFDRSLGTALVVGYLAAAAVVVVGGVWL
ncbi:hypothetical protein PtA15_15A80 [Puccinia triticina]|uniref:Sodium/calcium exchanger membrane region domain-containing protein n=2 Tax=Puccinia triticina TaxID=208348 RepID=A0ABY7D4G0_9BASI|nr:uncharacterized protein PtA15_15A80 [Puccinia triticina]WAQ91689.1 hypothetical protein PtA15_15A80 [Puccinia triticina]